MGYFLFQQFYLSKIKFAISLDVTEIHEGPSAIFSKIGSVRPGEKVLVGEENNKGLEVGIFASTQAVENNLAILEI